MAKLVEADAKGRPAECGFALNTRPSPVGLVQRICRREEALPDAADVGDKAGNNVLIGPVILDRLNEALRSIQPLLLPLQALAHGPGQDTRRLPLQIIDHAFVIRVPGEFLVEGDQYRPAPESVSRVLHVR